MPITATDLANILNDSVKNGKLTLSDKLLNKIAAGLVDSLPLDEIGLANVNINVDGKNVVLSGEVQGDWNPGGMEYALLRNVKITITFFVEKQAYKATFAMTADLIVSKKTIPVTGSVDTDRNLKLTLAAGEITLSFATLTHLATNGRIDNLLPKVKFYDSVTLKDLDLSMNMVSTFSTSVSVVADLKGELTIIPGFFALDQLSAEISADFIKEDDGGYDFFYSGELYSLLTFGTELKVSMPFTGGDNIRLNIYPVAPDSRLGLLHLSSLLGGAGLKSVVKEGLDTLKFDGIDLERVSMSYDLKQKSLDFITADGQLIFAGQTIELTVTIPGDLKSGWLFAGQTAPGVTLPVGELVNSLTSRFGRLDLPAVFSGTTVHDLKVAFNSGSRASSIGFTTDIPVGRQKLVCSAQVDIKPTADTFDKSFSAGLKLGDLLFSIDLEGSEAATSFVATFDNSQNLPRNIGQAGYGAVVPSRGTLDKLLPQLIPPLAKIVPAPVNNLLSGVKVSDSSLTFGNLVTVNYHSLTLDYTKAGSDTTWKVDFNGGISVKDAAHLQGQLSVVIGKESSVTFNADAESGHIAALPIPYPTNDHNPSVQLQFKSVEIKKDSGGYQFDMNAEADFKDFPSLASKVIPESTAATLSLSKSKKSLSVSQLTRNVEFELPAIPLSDWGEVELGKMSVDLSDLAVEYTKTPALSVNLSLGLPSELNNIFGVKSNGRPKVELFNTYDPKDPDNTVVKIHLTADSRKLSMTLLNSPLKAVNTIQKNGRAWWDIDLGDFGAAEVMVPEFAYSAESGALQASGGFDITKPLSLPMTPLISLFKAVKLGAVADLIPEAIPIKDINIFDKQNKLNTGELKKLFGSKLPKEVNAALNVINSEVGRLPDRLKSYFRFTMPQSLMFDISIDGSGGVAFSLAVKEGDPPIKLLYPSMQGPIPALAGIELRKVAFGEILSGQLFTLEIDATFDHFNILTIAGSLIIPTQELKVLPNSKNLVSTFELKNLYSIIFYQTGVPVPIPLFYDKIGLQYLGLEGLGVGSAFSCPKPSLDFGELAQMLGAFVQFFTKKDYLLDPDHSPEHMDIKFFIEGNYIELPKYMGAELLGKKTEIADISAYNLIAHALNWLKTFDVNEFIQSFPLKYRVGNETISFFSLAGINVAWALTTPQEFVSTAYQKLDIEADQTNALLAVLPATADKKDEGLVVYLRGGFNIAKVVAFESVFALCGSTGTGFATGFRHRGMVAGIIQATLSGSVAIHPGEKPIFALKGQTELSILEKPVMKGLLELSDSGLQMSGLIDLFPGLAGIQAKAQVAGVISASRFELLGNMKFAIKGVTVISGAVKVDTQQLAIFGNFLGLKTSLVAGIDNGALSLASTVGTTLALKFNTGAIRIAGVKVTDGLSVDVSAGLTLDIRVTSQGFILGVRAAYKFQGYSFKTSFVLRVVPNDIKDLTERLIKEVIKQAAEIFKQIYGDATQWLNDVGSGAIVLADKSAAALANVFKTIYGQTAEETAQLLKGAGYAVDQMAQALKNAYGQTAEEAVRILQGAGYAAEQVGLALKNAYNQTAQQAAGFLKKLGYGINDVAETLEQSFGQEAQAAANTLKAAGYPANEVAKVLQDVFHKGAAAAAEILKSAKYGVNEVGGALKTTFKLGAEQAAKTLKGAKYLARDTAAVLKNVYGSTGNEAAKAMRQAGYTANQIGATLKDVFNFGINQAALGLKYAGYAASDVGNALKGTFSDSVDAVGNALKFAGYQAGEVADTLKKTFNASAEAVTAFLKNSFGLGSSGVKSILQGIGYAPSAIENAFKTIFNIFPYVKIPYVKLPYVKIPHVKIW